jgi:hypothetical protein
MEEEQTRLGGQRREVEQALPRVVVGGCGAGEQDAESSSFSLFLVAVSDPESEDSQDPLARSPVELMALDRETGRYNFYEVRAVVPSGMPLVSRFTQIEGTRGWRRSVDTSKDSWSQGPGGECFGCHRLSLPLLNERTGPWHRWISPRKTQFERSYSGGTGAWLAWTLGAGGKAPSHASALEAMVLAGAEHAARGAMTSGEGVQQALRALLCQVELEFVTETAELPMEVFLDPSAIEGSFLPPPRRLQAQPVVQFPARSFTDRAIASALVDRGLLRRRTALASRVLDDEQDAFSPRRCRLLEELEGLPDDALDEALQAAIRREAAADPLPARGAYLRALVDSSLADGALVAFRKAYFSEVGARLKEADKRLKSPEGASWLKARIDARRELARQHYPVPASPLPVWKK